MANTLTGEEFIQKTAELGDSVGYSVVSVDPLDSTLRIIRINILDKQTMEAIEEVDVLTTANAVLFPSGRTLPQELDVLMKYTNTNQVPVDIGGIEEDASFVDVPIKDLITQLLYPYTPPVSVITSSNTVYYQPFGTNIAPAIITLNVSKKTDTISGANLLHNGEVYTAFTDLSASGGTSYITYNNDTSEINGPLELVASVTDAKGISSSNVIKYTFNKPLYVGCLDANASLVSDTIKTLNEIYEYDTITGLESYRSLVHIDHEFNPNEQFMAFAHPVNRGVEYLLHVTDPNGFDISSSFEGYRVSVTDSNGVAMSYICWTSNITTQRSFLLNIDLIEKFPK